MQAYGKVGKKGTLYPPKNIRDKLELKEGDMVRYVVERNNLLVVKISDPLKVASELNIPFNTKTAINIISAVRKESETEIEEELLKNIKKEN